MPIKKGDKIKVEYTGTLEDNTVFDSSEKQGKPLEFEVGGGMIIKGFDEAVVGMEVDEEKEITLPPEEAYGQINPQLVQNVPKEQLPKDQEIKEGMMLMVGLPNGMQLPAKVIEITENEVKIDVNHPLAGKTLNFKIKIVGFSEENDKGPINETDSLDNSDESEEKKDFDQVEVKDESEEIKED